MTKEEYIKLRNTNSITLNLLYDYYLNHVEDKKVNSIEEFAMVWNIIAKDNVIIFNKYDEESQFYHQQIIPIDYNKILEYYDNKFNITKIINIKDSKIIRYE